MNERKTGKPFGEYELGIGPAERKIVIAGMMGDLRKMHGYSQREVADLLEVSPQTYNGWEKARNEPPVEYLVRLSYLYDVSMDAICGKGLQKVPTKQNIAEDIADMRMQITQAERQLDEIADENQRKQAEAMLQGMRAMVNALEEANKKGR